MTVWRYPLFAAMTVLMLSLSPAAFAANPAPKQIWNPVRTNSPESLEELKSLERAATDVANQATPCTVGILVDSSIGSGVIVSPDGLVLTAAHVIGETGRALRIVLFDGTVVKGKVLGVDGKADVGLVQITDTVPKNVKWTGTEEGKWPCVPIGKGSVLRSGQWVISLGHPGGIRRERPPSLRIGRFTGYSSMDDFLRTDCTLAPGDSGGPLLDLQGKLIGIHSRVEQFANDNMHLAIEVFLDRWAVLKRAEIPHAEPAIKDPESVQGIADRGKKLLPRLFTELAATTTRATVRIQCDGRDALLGTIVSAEGHILTKRSDLRGSLTCILQDGTVYEARVQAYHKASDLALLKIQAESLKPISFAQSGTPKVGHWVAVPGNDEEPIAVGLVSTPVRKLYGEQAVIENANKGFLGISELVDMANGAGIEIGKVISGSAAVRAGLQKKDVIFAVSNKNVRNREQFLIAMDPFWPGDSVTLSVRRAGEEMVFKVKLTSRGDVDNQNFQQGIGGALSGRRSGFPAVFSHDTILRPTDCGGLLIDREGRILGLNIARAGRDETWALPVEVFQPILEELLAGKHIETSR